jgi:hypothetical protein
MRTNYVLIDYENVQPENLSLLASEHFRIIVFVGQSQPSIRTGLAIALQSYGARAAYVKIEGNGPNALDFHIAYYIGRLAEKDKSAFFHVISKDTGFDPLIAHLKTRGIFAKRSINIQDIPILQATTALPAAPVVAAVTTKVIASTPAQVAATAPASSHTDIVITHMKKMVKNLPGSEKALRGTLSSWLRPMSAAGQQHVLQELIRLKIIVIDSGRVRYSLPA